MKQREEFEARLRTIGSPWLSLTTQQIGLLFGHYESLVKWNKVMNLTRVDSLEEAAVRHYGESLFLACHLPKGIARVADIGSGPGFPGFPLAVARPEIEVTLVEPVAKKAAFLRVAARIPNVSIKQCRSDQLRGEFDWLVSRAVKAEEVLEASSRLGARVALLVSASDALLLRGFEQLALPWVGGGVLLLSRE
jgi:16S rRNA (guanine527-N7)-methyltransferase